ncbi:MAG: hypothetical protein ACR2QH_19535 [Geminicoccaceae bacterium]
MLSAGNREFLLGNNFTDELSDLTLKLVSRQFGGSARVNSFEQARLDTIEHQLSRCCTLVASSSAFRPFVVRTR